MRDPVGPELLILARCLIVVPQTDQRALAARLISEASLAARHVGETGTLHPKFGDGSLMACCHRLSPPPEPTASDARFLRAIVVASQALLDHFHS
jgi:hypothetical protein